jgi:hypothetical protein
MASYTNSSSKSLYLYPVILSLTSGTKNTSGIGLSVLKELLTLSNIHSNILIL